LIDMGDFVGGTLKYLCTHLVERLTIAGGFANLAVSHLDLHSARRLKGLEAALDWLARAQPSSDAMRVS
jgi:cobalt-precorrin-5B (C1)-methyltransferase